LLDAIRDATSHSKHGGTVIDALWRQQRVVVENALVRILGGHR
jgi:hypothetical protein